MPGYKASHAIFLSVLVGLTNALSITAEATQFEPEALAKYTEHNRLNHITITPLRFCPGWRKSLKAKHDQGCELNGFRTILKVDGAGKALLNPQEPFSFAWSMFDFKSISAANAKDLFGGKINIDGTTTCDLVSEDCNKEANIYHLDLKYTEGKLSEYRLRGIGITNPDWISVLKTPAPPTKTESAPDAFGETTSETP